MVTTVKPSVAILKEIQLLSVFTEAELGQLLRAGASQTFEAHANVVIEGELTWGLFLILEGVVGIFKNNKLTSDIYDVGQLREGNFFGEMSLIDDNPRSATVRALSDSQLFFISKDSFQAFLNQSSDLKLRFYEACIRTTVGRLRELDDSYVISQYQLWKTALLKEAA